MHAPTASERDSIGQAPGARPQEWALLGALSFLTFAAHMLVSGRYGYFRDELYYLACSHHLAWGYVDQPPLIAVIAWLVRVTLGDSLHALRFLPAVAAGLRVLLTGRIARELGARRFGMLLACVCVMVAPIYLGLDSLLTMNPFESLFWTGAALIALKIFNGARARLWLLFGAVCGVGLLNKDSMLFFGFGLFVGLLLTKQRRQFASPWIWLGGLIALAIFLPNLLWQIHRGFPTIELLRNVQRSGRNSDGGPLAFLVQQVLALEPLAAPVWIAGLVEMLRDPLGKGWRVLGITWIVIILCMLTLHGRVYYPVPAYPMLFAAGGLAFERWLAGLRGARFLKPASVALLAVAGLLLAPFANFPMLTVDGYLAYARFWHIEPPRIENHSLGPLPQVYADQFGWEEMAQVVANAYRSLPPEEQKSCAIFAQDYGQAGAIDFFGAKMGLPSAISGHQNYFYWGPRGYTGQCMIVMDDDPQQLHQLFDAVQFAGRVEHPLSMPYEHFDIYICRKPKFGSLQQAWPRIKHWD